MKKNLTIEDNEKFLRQKSRDVKFNDEELLHNIKDLEEFCLANKVFAMAAVQIGIPKRIIYVKNTSPDEEKIEDLSYNISLVLINPKIIKRIGHTKFWEACASCLLNMGLVSRPYKIELEYYDENFNKMNKVFEGFEATVISHELDHLEGILHIDIAEKILQMSVDERKKYRKNHPYEIISKDCDYEKIR